MLLCVPDPIQVKEFWLRDLKLKRDSVTSTEILEANKAFGPRDDLLGCWEK